MGHFWNAVQFWDEWQLRILVLGSLAVQWFLLVAAPMRKYTIPHWFRTFIWMSYLTSDALAIYALATLFNRHAKVTSSCGNGASVLEVLWAPVLLIHLGGQEEMAAYNIEDNELWTRQTVTLVSQVSVAVYAFYKSWPSSGDRRLMDSAVVLFVIGVLSFSEKPWALRRACIDRLAAVSAKIEGVREVSRWKFCFTELEGKQKSSLLFWKKGAEEEREEGQVFTEGDKVHMILSDMSLFAAASDLKKRRSRGQKRRPEQGSRQWRGVTDRVLEEEDEEEEEQHLGPGIEVEDEVLPPLKPGADVGTRWLRRAFKLIYTRANVVYTPAYLFFHLLLAPSLHAAAIALFAVSHKSQGYNAADVKTTYILLCFTAALDVLAGFIPRMLYRVMLRAGVPALCETIPQHNLVAAVRRRTQRRHGWLLWCADRIGVWEGYFFCRTTERLYSKVAAYVVIDLVDAARKKGLDVASYRSFAGPNWALREDLKKACGAAARRSLRESFDESVLLWHIATDLCFRRSGTPANAGSSVTQLRRECTQAISNYMAYLLYSKPQMLMTGSRQHLFTEAMRNVKAIMAKIAVADDGGTLDEASLVDDIIRGAASVAAGRQGKPGRIKYPLIYDASMLAKELKELPDNKRWELMYRVWLGMLAYSASMCRGYLHAKSLGEGGEFLSYVWLILSLKGAKTLADKLQMPEPEPGQEEEEEVLVEKITAPDA
ncbi:hypothetical protein ACP4OV_014748 [Aristida adscensionis]